MKELSVVCNETKVALQKLLIWQISNCWFSFRLFHNHYGELGNLCVLPGRVRWFSCVGFSDCYFVINCCCPWVRNHRSCCFGEYLRGGHNTLCFPFSRLIHKSIGFFVVIAGSVRLSSLKTGSGLAFFSQLALLTCLVKQGQRMPPRLVNEYTVVSHEVHPIDWPC